MGSCVIFRLEQLFVMALSMEITDAECCRLAFESPHFRRLFPQCEKQVEASDRVRAKTAPPLPRVIFSSSAVSVQGRRGGRKSQGVPSSTLPRPTTTPTPNSNNGVTA